MDLKTLISQNQRSGLYLLDISTPPDEIKQIAETFAYAFFYLQGNKIQNKEDLFVTIKKLLNLPSDLGENWDAFYDCLTGFPWPPAKGYILLYDDVEYFADNHGRDFYIALSAFQRAALDTDHNGKFYVLLKASKSVLPDEFKELEEVQI